MNRAVFSVFNPLFVFAVSWLTVLTLYMMQPVDVLYLSDGFGLAYMTFLILAAAILSVIFGYKWELLLDTHSAIKSSKGKIYAKLFFAAALLEVALKGLPPIFTGEDYTSWGISGLHGFINVLGLYVSYWYFTIFLLATNRERITVAMVLLLVFLWQIFVLNRAIMMLNLVGLLYIAISMKRLKIKHFIVAPVAMIFLIGLVGDLRGMGEDFIFVITKPKPWAEDMGVGFVWVVTYFTTAISNLMFNIEQGQSTNFYPALFFNEFLPNIFKFDLNNADMMLYEGMVRTNTWLSS